MYIEQLTPEQIGKVYTEGRCYVAGYLKTIRPLLMRERP